MVADEDKLPKCDYNHIRTRKSLARLFIGRESRQMATADLALGQPEGALSTRQRVIKRLQHQRSYSKRLRLAIRQ